VTANFRALCRHVLSDEVLFQMLRALESIDRRLGSKLAVIRRSVKNISSIRHSVENIDYRVRRMQQKRDNSLRCRHTFSIRTVNLNFQNEDRECISYYVLIFVSSEEFEIASRLSSELLISVSSSTAFSFTHYRVSESSYSSLSIFSQCHSWSHKIGSGSTRGRRGSGTNSSKLSGSRTDGPKII
jgi:hypothetical protein